MPEPIPCLIRILSPVHLGADEVYDPLSFVIDEDNHRLVAFEPWSFLEKLPEGDRRTFAHLCRQATVSSLLEIYRFFRERRPMAQGRAVAVCPGLVQHYRQVLKLSPGEFSRQLTQFTIHRTAHRTSDERPYLPGSAVKGALRTAYLNALAKVKPMATPRDNRGKYDPRALEQRLLEYRKIVEDPFRLLKISDFQPVGEVKTRIVYAVNEKKKISPFPARGPYQILEVIEPGAVFAGTVCLEELSRETRGLSPIRHFLTREDLWYGARTFYQQVKDLEDRDLHELGVPRLALTAPPNGLPLRLGRHSGAESVTIEGHRKIKILKGKGQPPEERSNATTLWLAADFPQRDQRHRANLRPMGWAALEELGAEAARELGAREEAWRREGGTTSRVMGAQGRNAPPPAGPKPVPQTTLTEDWAKARLTWHPGKQTLTAACAGKKAEAKGMDLVPPGLREKLKKTKGADARVTVAVEGNFYRLVKVEAIS